MRAAYGNREEVDVGDDASRVCQVIVVVAQKVSTPGDDHLFGCWKVWTEARAAGKGSSACNMLKWRHRLY